jgi:cytochrome oxidase assembly protein ShyY1
VLRFLLTRRWLGLLLVVLLVSFACVELGLWQFRRYTEAKTANAQITANLHSPATTVSHLMSASKPPAAAAEWRVVTARGRYDARHQIAVLYRTRNGSPGVDVVTPLRTTNGVGLVVDRGWLRTPGSVESPKSLPAPPRGLVTVTGWVRINADDGSTETIPSGGAVRAISSAGIQRRVPYRLYDGFVEAIRQSPPEPELAAALPPDLSTGPHFFYGLQWFLFATLAIGFWVYFARSEYLQLQGKAQRSRARTASAAALNREHRPGGVPSRR